MVGRRLTWRRSGKGFDCDLWLPWTRGTGATRPVRRMIAEAGIRPEQAGRASGQKLGLGMLLVVHMHLGSRPSQAACSMQHSRATTCRSFTCRISVSWLQARRQIDASISLCWACRHDGAIVGSRQGGTDRFPHASFGQVAPCSTLLPRETGKGTLRSVRRGAAQVSMPQVVGCGRIGSDGALLGTFTEAAG